MILATTSLIQQYLFLLTRKLLLEVQHIRQLNQRHENGIYKTSSRIVLISVMCKTCLVHPYRMRRACRIQIFYSDASTSFLSARRKPVLIIQDIQILVEIRVPDPQRQGLESDHLQQFFGRDAADSCVVIKRTMDRGIFPSCPSLQRPPRTPCSVCRVNTVVRDASRFIYVETQSPQHPSRRPVPVPTRQCPSRCGADKERPIYIPKLDVKPPLAADHISVRLASALASEARFSLRTPLKPCQLVIELPTMLPSTFWDMSPSHLLHVLSHMAPDSPDNNSFSSVGLRHNKRPMIRRHRD